MWRFVIIGYNFGDFSLLNVSNLDMIVRDNIIINVDAIKVL